MRAESIRDLLPDVLARTAVPGSVLQTLLEAAERQHEGTEALVSEFDHLLDPARCPERFLPWLAGWVGLGWLVAGGPTAGGISPSRLRSLVAMGAELAAWRGTEPGLLRLLAVATGVDGFAAHVGEQPFTVTIEVPAEASGDIDLVRRIVRHEVPICVLAQIHVIEPGGGDHA